MSNAMTKTMSTLKEFDFNTGNVYTLSQSTINAGGTDGNLIDY